MKLVVLPAARADILRQFEFYAETGGHDLAERFLAATRQSLTTLAEMPNLGAPKSFHNPRLSGLRSWPVPGFDVLRVYYLVSQDHVTALRLLHGRRDIELIFDSDDL